MFDRMPLRWRLTLLITSICAVTLLAAFGGYLAAELIKIRQSVTDRMEGTQRLLVENLVNTNSSQSVQSGTVTEGQRQFNYTMRSDPWSRDPSQNVIRQLSVEVKFTAQNRDYSVRMSTLVDSSLQ